MRVNVRGRRRSSSSTTPRSMESYAFIVADASRSELATRSRGGVRELQPRAEIKHGPILAGVVTGVAGVVMVGRTYGASLFGRMTTYIN